MPWQVGKNGEVLKILSWSLMLLLFLRYSVLWHVNQALVMSILLTVVVKALQYCHRRDLTNTLRWKLLFTIHLFQVMWQIESTVWQAGLASGQVLLPANGNSQISFMSFLDADLPRLSLYMCPSYSGITMLFSLPQDVQAFYNFSNVMLLSQSYFSNL